MRVTLLCSLLLLFAGSEIAQDFSHFEVASVKPAAPFPGATPGTAPNVPPSGGIGTSNPRQITYRAIWLSALIQDAYNIRGFQISGPVPNDRYDIVANIPEGATTEQFHIMMQNLLRERFNLTFHRESKIFSAYGLVVAKNGPKLKESPKQTEPTPISPAKGQVDKDGFPVLPSDYFGLWAGPGNGGLRLVGQRVTLNTLVTNLEGGMATLAGIDGPIVNETGLTGRYDFKLEFEYRLPGTAASLPGAAPSIFAALEKELGLKLESKKLTFDVLVVDQLEKVPTEN